VTKKRKPSRASLNGVTWFAEPAAKTNVVSAEAEWSKIPILWHQDGTGTMAVPLHDETNSDLARLLLKMGLELLAVRDAGQETERDRRAAKNVVLGNDTLPWPYFVLRDKQSLSRLTSVFEATPDAREYVQNLGFNLYLHEVADDEILFFQYGEFLAAISLTSRSVNWIALLKKWGAPYAGCPVEFAHLHS
jgi:hypothetical protein